MTRAEYKTEPDKIAVKDLIRLFNEYFLPERNTYHNRGEFNRTEKELITANGSPVLKMPAENKIMKETEIQKVKHRYQDVNKNEVKFRGKIPVDIEYENNEQKKQLLISQSDKRRTIEKFRDLFRNNTTMKDHKINIQLKPGHYPVKQKARPIPLYLQEAVGKKLKN